MAITVAALAEWLDGHVLGDETLLIDRARSLSKAGPGSIAFFAGTKVAGLKPVEAAAILIARELDAGSPPARATHVARSWSSRIPKTR